MSTEGKLAKWLNIDDDGAGDNGDGDGVCMGDDVGECENECEDDVDDDDVVGLDLCLDLCLDFGDESECDECDDVDDDGDDVDDDDDDDDEMNDDDDDISGRKGTTQKNLLPLSLCLGKESESFITTVFFCSSFNSG